MSAFDVYVTYLAIKAHFTRKNYDYFKYGGRIKTSEEKFHNRNDRYFFEKLSKKMGKQELEHYFVSNFLATSNFWVGYMDEKYFIEWQKRAQSISYLFSNDLDKILNTETDLNEALKCKNGRHSVLLKMFLADKIMLETMVLLNRKVNFVKRYDQILSQDPIWGRISELIKRYDPFVKMNNAKIKDIILQKV
jgi:hypothetical protein